MKESILDVLMYLFENYMDEEEDNEQDREFLTGQLHAAGFRHAQINRAFDWLEGLSAQQEQLARPSQATSVMRVFSEEEMIKLNVECRGFLLLLEQSGLLDLSSRELIIDRIMALDNDEVSLDQLKWVVLV